MVRAFRLFLLMGALATLGTSCNFPSATATPVPTPTPTQTPSPTPVPTAVLGLSQSAEAAFRLLPVSVRSAMYIDVKALRAHPLVDPAVDRLIDTYTGAASASAITAADIEASVFSLRSPFRLAVKGSFSGPLLIALLSLGGFGAGSYRDVRYARLPGESLEGILSFIAFPADGTALLAETLPGLKGMIDVSAPAGSASMLEQRGAVPALGSVGPGLIVLVGDPKELDSSGLRFEGLRATYSGVGVSVIDQDTAEIAVFLLFGNDLDFTVAQASLGVPQKVAEVFELPSDQVGNVRLEVSNRQLLLRARIPTTALVQMVRQQIETTVSGG